MSPHPVEYKLRDAILWVWRNRFHILLWPPCFLIAAWLTVRAWFNDGPEASREEVRLFFYDYWI